MRLPGTVNSKHGDVRQVKVERLEADRRYDFDELEEAVAGWRPLLMAKEAPVRAIKASRKGATPAPAEGGSNPFLAVAEAQGWKPPLDVEQALADMTYPGNVHDTQIRVAASLAKAGVDRADAVRTILDATQAVVGTTGWDWKVEEKAIGSHYDSAVDKFDIPSVTSSVTSASVSRETPKTSERFVESPVTVAGKGAAIGAENVVQFTKKAAKGVRKPQKNDALQTAFVVTDGLIETLRQDGQDIMLAEGGIWIYQDGFWRTMSPADEQRLRTIIQQGFEDLGEAAKGNTLTLAWKRLTEHPKLYKAKVPWSAGGLIVCRNGVLAVDVGQFGPHAPDNYATRCIGSDFDLAATCPRFEALLFNMLGDQERVALVQEWLGAALSIRSLSREERRALIMVGPSRTGKTELARIFRLLLGKPIATPSVAEVSDDRDKFSLSSLYGAVAWIRDDAINEGDKLNPQRFKTIVTGEPTDVGLKHRDTVRDYCFEIPVCLTCNGLPKAIDASDAIYNRSLILKMTNVIDEEAAAMVRREEGVPRGQSIGTAIFEQEGAGILNWALVGLARLRARGYFEIPASVRDAIAQFKDDNNPVGTWASEAMEADPWSKVARHDLVRSYNGWQLEQEGDRAVGRGGAWLLPKIRNLIKGLGDLKTHSGTRFITGVKLTAVGLATWESYGKASPRNGPGGLAQTVQAVNQAHDADENQQQQSTDDIPF
jgi:P4 family phage/plasmid primase-like protien